MFQRGTLWFNMQSAWWCLSYSCWTKYFLLKIWHRILYLAMCISEFYTLKKVWSQNPDSRLYSAKDFIFSMNVTYYFIKMLLSLVYPWKQEDLKIFNCLNIIYWHVTNLMGLWCNLWQLSTSAPCTKEDRCKYKLLLRVSFLQSMLSSARETTLAGSDWKMIPKVSSI